jgi:tRNA-specific 2-thiouridylase
MKAIGMISGGLDSTLAAHVIVRAGVAVELVHFTSCFFGTATVSRSGHVRAVAEQLGVPLHDVPFSAQLMELVRNPPHGHGRNLNPCIDCHANMLTVCRERMPQLGAGFVFTGEVLGQRPFSQNRNALRTVARSSGLDDLLVRPLSAKCLDPTRPEIEGWVDREQLLGLSGRSRKPQMELARQWGITDYPQPAGGCLLTEPTFCLRLAELMEHEGLGEPDILLLKVGRHFRFAPRTRIVVGRDQADCEALAGLAREGDWLLELADAVGPLTVLRGEAEEAALAAAAGLTVRYSKQSGRPAVRVRARRAGGGGERIIEAAATPIEDLGRWMIASEVDRRGAVENLRARA